uniref:Secreted protein n=1 Tax=Anopheles funestus TaxID=62324 RepID=A0A182RWI6_ANOFN
MRKSLCLLLLVIVLCSPYSASAAPLTTDMDQMEEMEVLGLVGCNHAVTVTALPLPGFTVSPEPRQQKDSESSTESEESVSASRESPSVREMRTEDR